MGTTLTALMLLHSHVVVAQVGDSRAYIWRQGRLTQITHDQSLVNQLLDSGQITPEQAKLFEHSNVILQALGVQEDIEVILSSETLRRDDRLLLCSDGLVGVVTDEEIQEVIANTENLEEGVQRLIDMARAGGGPDNITVILAQAFGEGVLPAAAEEQAQYRAMALDGDKPQERRTWSADYSYAGSASAGRDIGPSSASSGRFVSPVSLLSMAAVLALAVTGLVVGLVLYPQHKPDPLVACTISTDQPGLQVGFDDKPPTAFAGLNVELKLPPGERKLWLAKPQDGGRHFGEQTLLVTAGQPCGMTLPGDPVGSNPPAAAADAAVVDSVRPAERDGGVADAATPATTPTGPEDPEEPAPRENDNDPGNLHKKRPHKRHVREKSDLGASGTAAPTPGTDTPAANPDLASPAAAPAKPEKPVEPTVIEKPVPEKIPEKPAVTPPPADKPAPAAEKPTASPSAPEKTTP